MKKRYGVFPLFALVMCICGCSVETDDQIADRVIKRREELASVVGVEIAAIIDEPYRTTTILLKDGRRIVVQSREHAHETKVVGGE